MEQSNDKMLNISIRMTLNQRKWLQYAMAKLGFTSINAYLLNSGLERARKLSNESKNIVPLPNG